MSLIHRLLWRLTDQLPRREIPRDGGGEYLDRYFVGRRFGCTVYLHHFKGGDTAEVPHDHPWRWSFALILTGSYKELVVKNLDSADGFNSRKRWMSAGRINLIGPRTIHAIETVHPDTWTLFVHGQVIRRWGFYEVFDSLFGRTEVRFFQPHQVMGMREWWKSHKSRYQARHINRLKLDLLTEMNAADPGVLRADQAPDVSRETKKPHLMLCGKNHGKPD